MRVVHLDTIDEVPGIYREIYIYREGREKRERERLQRAKQVLESRYFIYSLHQYKSTNTDAEA